MPSSQQTAQVGGEEPGPATPQCKEQTQGQASVVFKPVTCQEMPDNPKGESPSALAATARLAFTFLGLSHRFIILKKKKKLTREFFFMN